MPKAASINFEILKWARKSARISLEKAAGRISKTCKPERIRAWETPGSKEFPTLKQVEKLAKLYRRPAEVFYMPYIPPDFPVLKDFRSNRDEGMDTALVFLMREVQEKQGWLSKFLRSKKEKALDFVGKYTIKSPVQEVANHIRKTLGIRTSKPGEKPLKHWIEQAERKRIFVALSSNFHSRLKLDSNHVKGFVVSDKFAPFVFVNSKDYEEGQLYSFVHLLVHVWINVSGIVNDTGPGTNDSSGLHVVERFCRNVADKALLPEAEINTFLTVKGELNLRHIANASRRLGVSKMAVLQRAKQLNLLQEDIFVKLKKDVDLDWKDFLIKQSQKPKSSGGPNYYVLALRRSGKAFSNMVMDVYKSGGMSGTEASRLLNVKEANFIKFEKFIYK